MVAQSNKSISLLPLNQIASLKLKEAGVEMRFDMQPVFQLMSWGLVAGLKCTHQRTVCKLMRLRFDPDYERSYQYLVDNVPGGLVTFERQLLQQSPQAVALELIDLLDMRLKADPTTRYPERAD